MAVIKAHNPTDCCFSYAPWCPACKALGETWDAVASWGEDLDIKVAKVDVTENPGEHLPLESETVDDVSISVRDWSARVGIATHETVITLAHHRVRQ